jgi:hypothetical protein
MINELDYAQDPLGRVRFYGIYEATVDSTADPLKQNRIQVRVKQPTGTEVTGWAKPCLPITDTSNHPDHLPHLASEVAALLQAHGDHTVSGTTASGGSTPHTHTFSVTVSHTNNHTGKTPDSTNQLKHPHVTTVSTDRLWNDKIEQGIEASLVTKPEHTAHRLIPKQGATVWVMFEAGDPEYPVWMGVLSQK